MLRIRKLALGCAALILVHEMPGQEIKFGEPQEVDSSRFAERTVWIPYWTEKDGHHTLLHLRNALHHYPLTASVEVLSQTGIWATWLTGSGCTGDETHKLQTTSHATNAASQSEGGRMTPNPTRTILLCLSFLLSSTHPTPLRAADHLDLIIPSFRVENATIEQPPAGVRPQS
jgi:hypothetical protein